MKISRYYHILDHAADEIEFHGIDHSAGFRGFLFIEVPRKIINS